MRCHASTDSLVPSLELPRARRPSPADPCARPSAARSVEEPHGAVVVVVEQGAGWPRSFEEQRRGHADVAIVAQQPGEGGDELLRRARRRVGELREAGRCARTVVLAASRDPDAPGQEARALLLRALVGVLCQGCSTLRLVGGGMDAELQRQLRAVALTLADQTSGMDVEVS